MTRKKPAVKDGLSDWWDLHEDLSTRGKNLSLSHEVMITKEGLGPNANEIGRALFREAGHRLVGRITVPLSESSTEEHLFYAADESIFELFRQTLIRIDLLLDKFPANLYPQSKTIDLPSRPDIALVRWLRFLFYLSWKVPDHTLQAGLNCAFDEFDGLPLFKPFSDVPLIDEELDPWEQISGVGRPSMSLNHWRSRVEGMGRSFPYIFNAHFYKELFYASANGIKIILSKATSIKNAPERKAAPTRRAEDSKALLIGMLFAHHKPLSEACESNLTREELAGKLGWDPAKVTRTAKMIFKGGFTEYRRLCSSRNIIQFLQTDRFKEFGELVNRNNLDLSQFQDYRSANHGSDDSED